MQALNRTFLPSQGHPRREIFSAKTADIRAHLNEFEKGLAATPVAGVSIELAQPTSSAHTWAVAIAARDDVLVITSDFLLRSARNKVIHSSILNLFLRQNAQYTLCGFHMERLVLHLDRFLRDGNANGNKSSSRIVACGVDLTTLSGPDDESSRTPGEAAFKKFPDARTFDINELWNSVVTTGSSLGELDHLVHRAWISFHVASASHKEVAVAQKVGVGEFEQWEKRFLSQFALEIEMGESSKPRQQWTEFSSIEPRSGNFAVSSTRYQNRLRVDQKRRVTLLDAGNNEYSARAVRAEGRETQIQTRGGQQIKYSEVVKIRVDGTASLLSWENGRDMFLLRVLQGNARLHDSPFIRYIWNRDLPDFEEWNVYSNQQAVGRLNPSQSNVAAAMLSTELPVVIVHGPPGTGKTSTICASVREWYGRMRGEAGGTWITAQSNVGVKNIAESLIKTTLDFRLLVSKEFYVEWHEHIYSSMLTEKLIRADEIDDALRTIPDSVQIILTTVGMMSNPTLLNNNVFQKVPVDQLIIDEASQIGLFNLAHLFHSHPGLRKASFFGDPKQLPPFKHAGDANIQSIFDVLHFERFSYLLNIQYRMPEPLGDFISGAIYASELYSKHSIRTMDCVAFVDARGEEDAFGKSFRNAAEADIILTLVEKYYKSKRFCILTPYDAQRSYIQERLKAQNLTWETVFSVDSFQGNEMDFVLISVVRTQRPGFLTSLNRLNVMLTRAKAGLIVVGNRDFIKSHDTLLRTLCEHWERRCRVTEVWKSLNEILNERCSLPGVGAARPVQSGSGAVVHANSPQSFFVRSQQAIRPWSQNVSSSWAKVAALDSEDYPQLIPSFPQRGSAVAPRQPERESSPSMPFLEVRQRAKAMSTRAQPPRAVSLAVKGYAFTPASNSSAPTLWITIGGQQGRRKKAPKPSAPSAKELKSKPKNDWGEPGKERRCTL